MVIQKIAEETIGIIQGLTPLPPLVPFNLPGFGVNTNPPNGDEPIVCHVNDLLPVYDGLNFDVKFYAFNNNGYVQLTATGAQAGMELPGVGQLGCSLFYEGGTLTVLANSVDTFPSEAQVSVFEISPVGINDGVSAGALTTLATGNILFGLGNVFPLFGYGINTNGPLGIVSNVTFVPNATAYPTVVISHAGGVINTYQVTEPGLDWATIQATIFNAGRYFSLCFPSVNATVGIYSLDWLPTAIGAPADAILTKLVFSGVEENENFPNVYASDNDYFYACFMYNSAGVPILPYIIKFDKALTEYTKYYLLPGDEASKLLFTNLLNGLGGFEFTLSGSDFIFMGGNDETQPVQYFIAGPAIPPLQQQLHPFSLSCQNYCLPLFSR